MKKCWLFLIALLCVFCVAISVAVAESGTYDGLDWDITEGVLTLGKEGETQTLETADRRYADSWPWYSERQYISSVVVAGEISLNGNVNYMFSGFPNVTSMDMPYLNTSGVTSMSYMFSGCGNMTALDVSNFETTNVTDMSYMFAYCYALTTLDVSSFDTSNVTTMSYMFSSCNKLNGLDVSNFNTSNVKNMSYMFSSCSCLATLDLSNFDTSKVTIMEYMFSGSGVQRLDISSFDISRASGSITRMYDGCTALSEVILGENNVFDENSWAVLPDNKKVDGVYYTVHWTNEDLSLSYKSSELCLFYNSSMAGCWTASYEECNQYAVYDYNTKTLYFVEASSVSDDGRTVYSVSGGSYTGYVYSVAGDVVTWSSYRSSIQKVVFVDHFAPSSMNGWFSGFSSCKQIDMSNLDTSNVVSMRYLFSSCSSLTSLDLSHLDTSNVVNMRGMFYGCTLSSLNVGSFDMSKVTNTAYMFYGCTGVTSLDVSNWVMPELTNMSYMFQRCTSLTSLDVSGFDTSKVTDMSYVFGSCQNLTSLDLSNFDTSNVTTMYGMFHSCSKLTSVDVSHFDTSSVTSMTYMFYNCGLLDSLDLSSFDTSSVTGSSYMFYGCQALTSLDLSGFNMVKNSGMGYMFDGCNAVEELILGQYNPFVGNNSSVIIQSEYINTVDGYHSVKWQHTTEDYPALTSVELKDQYIGDMAGVWRRVLGENMAYYAVYVASNDNTLYFVKTDGTVSYVSGSTQTVYSESGNVYTGVVYPLVPEQTLWSAQKSSVKHVIVVDPLAPTSLNSWFYGFSQCVSMNLEKLDTADVLDMSKVFYNCSKLTELHISSWNTSNVTDMSYMFYYCQALPVLNVSHFDTSNVTNMSSMFYYCRGLTNLDLNTFDTSHVTTMSNMFYYCSALENLEISHFDTQSLVSSGYMFYSCSSLPYLDLSGLDLSSVTSMDSMYSGTSKLRQVNLGNYNPFVGDGVSSVLPTITSSNGIYYTGCWKHTTMDFPAYSPEGLRDNYDASMSGVWQLELASSMGYAVYVDDDKTLYFITPVDDQDYASGSVQTLQSVSGNSYTGQVYPIVMSERYAPWRAVSNKAEHVVVVDPLAPTTMYGWFDYFSKCVDMDLEKLDTSHVTDMSLTFYECYALTSLDVSGFDTSNVTTMASMFYGCRKLTVLDVSNFDTSNVKNMSYMFYRCSLLTELDVSHFNTSNVTTMSGMFNECNWLTSLDVSDFDTSNVTTMSYMFSWCNRLETVDVSGFDTSNVVNMSYMFSQCNKLTNIDVSTWDTSSCKEFAYMFGSCSLIENIEVSEFDVSQATGLQGMFSGCYSLTSIDVSDWDTSSVTNMASMFASCRGLTALDVSNFDITHVTNLACMFQYCSGLESLDLSMWDTTSFENVASLFAGCSGLTDLNISSWVLKNVTSASAMFMSCSSLTELDIKYVTFAKYDGTITDIFVGCSNLEILDIYSQRNGTIDFTQLGHLKRIHLREFHGSAMGGSPHEWIREDGAYGPYRASDFRSNYGYTYYGSSVEDKAKAGWYEIQPCMVAVYCYNDDNTMYFLKTMDGFAGSQITYGTYGTVTRMEDGKEYTGILFALPDSRVEVNTSPTWYSYDNKTYIRHVKVLDEFTPANHSCAYWFSSFDNLIDVDLDKLDFTGVTSFYMMFANCWKLKYLDVSDWDTSSVTSMYSLFYDNYELEEVRGINNWDVSHVTSFVNFMTNCKKLKEFIAPDWKFCTDCEYISVYKWFKYCYALEKVDVAGWDVSKFTEFYDMFGYCQSLKEIDLTGWRPGYATYCSYMFEECTALEVVKMPDWKNLSSQFAIFSYCPNLRSITVGSDFKLDNQMGIVSIPSSSVPYKWVDADGTHSPCSTNELLSDYPVGFAGTWLWNLPDAKYYIKFEAPEGTIGSMPMVTVDSNMSNYVLPDNKFRRPGATFNYWKDNIKNYTYSNRSTIYANYYQPGDVVVLTAVFSGDGGEAITMEDGGFTFSLKKNQTAVFDGLPAETVYRVYEDTPYGWTLVADSNTSGVIVAEERSEAGFANSHTRNKCSVILSGEKFFDNERSGEDEYTFELIDENGQLVSTTRTRAGGDIVFDALTFTDEDVGHEFIYTVREVIPGSDGVIETPIDEALVYDDHEERIKVLITYQMQGDGSLYSHTSNLGDDGEKVQATMSVEPYSLYYHTSNMEDDKTRDMVGTRSDGSIRGDFIDQNPYAAVINIRNAIKMHVKITYSNPRGDDGLFALWLGEYEEVRSGEWTTDCNLNNTYKRYNGSESGLCVDEFDVYGNSLSLRYVSEAISVDDPAYTSDSNFGYHMEITIDELYMNGGQRSDGTPISDYADNQVYTDTVSVPGSDQLHVVLQYSSPRGDDGIFTIKDNAGNVVKTYSSTDVQNTLLQDEFDVDGDSVDVVYRSLTLDLNDPEYNEYSNYGYYMVVTPVSLSGAVGRVPFVVSTPNIDKNGVQQSDYEKGRDYVNVVSIPGASRLNFTIRFNMGSNDRLRLYEGNHPEYTYNSHMSYVGSMTGSTSSYYTYTVTGDTATFVFHADESSTGGNGYGYYATYTSNNDLTYLQAEVIYDDDGARFDNKSGPGYLSLTKVASGDYAPDGQFMFDVGFVDELGQELDLWSGLSYIIDQTVLPTEESLLTVYHVGIDKNGGEHVKYVERYPNLIEGDAFHVEAKTIRGYAYSNNTYTNDDASVITGVVTDNAEEIYLYYDAVPWTLTVRHVVIDRFESITSTKDVETIPVYYNDEIILQPKNYDGYMYTDNTIGLVAGEDLRGCIMPDGDMVVTLKYKATKKVVLSHENGYGSRSYLLTLPTTGYWKNYGSYYAMSTVPYRGLKTGQYGNVNLVDGVAEITLDGDTDIELIVPMDTAFRLDPVDGGTIPYVLYGEGATGYASSGSQNVSYVVRTASYEYSEYYLRMSGSTYRTLTFYESLIGNTGTEVAYNSYSYKMFPGEVVGTKNRQYHSSVSRYLSGYKYFWYVGQDVPADTLMPDADLTITQRFNIQITATIQYVKVADDNTETGLTYNRTMSVASFDTFTLPIYTYSGYSFMDAVCITDSSIVVTNNGSGYVTGTSNGDNFTVKIRYRAE